MASQCTTEVIESLNLVANIQIYSCLICIAEWECMGLLIHCDIVSIYNMFSLLLYTCVLYDYTFLHLMLAEKSTIMFQTGECVIHSLLGK